MGPGGLWQTNVLNSALPPKRLRPDTRLEHQDPASVGGSPAEVGGGCGSLWGPDHPNDSFQWWGEVLHGHVPLASFVIIHIIGAKSRVSHWYWRVSSRGWGQLWLTCVLALPRFPLEVLIQPEMMALVLLEQVLLPLPGKEVNFRYRSGTKRPTFDMKAQWCQRLLNKGWE